MTRRDRPAGRGLATEASPVKKLAAERGIAVIQPASLHDPSVRSELMNLRLEAIVTAAFGLIFPQAILDIPTRGAINVHASLLPRWRGAAPIQRALLAGDRATGISIMRMDAGLDTGPVLFQAETEISGSDTSGTLTARLEAGSAHVVPQGEKGVSYAPKVDKREARVDWRESAAAVDRRVRAFNPFPGASARLRGLDLKIWKGAVAGQRGEPGVVLSVDARGICVACGEGALVVEELQRSGGKRLGAADLLRGFSISPGERFEI
jgi:methionyl-tRNA formyltransferase